MEPTTASDDTTGLGLGAEIDIETAASRIAAEIARRDDPPTHRLATYQVVCSADRQIIWIASAVGPCMDLRFTPLELGPEQAWSWHCAEPDDDPHEIGWQISTSGAIVDLLEELLAGGSASGAGNLQ